MMYAINGDSWRAINSASDLQDGETLSLVAPPPEPEPIPDAYVFPVPILAPDFIVATPKIKDDPMEAIVEAIAEAEKWEGQKKSMGVMVLSLLKYAKHLTKQVEQLEQEVEKLKRK